MSSCGDPDTEQDAVMLRRQKFDKSKDCIKCKTKTGNIVVRYAVYCKECFFTLVVMKFRKSLEPSINATPNRRKALTASGNLLLGLSGGLGSTVLLDLVDRCYSSNQTVDEYDRLKGGKDHPRNTSVWQKAAVCYIETCNAFPEMTHRDKTDEIRAIVEKYDQLKFVHLRIEDAFNDAWWETVGGKPAKTTLGFDMSSEDLFLSAISQADSDGPVSRLRSFISSLPTQTAILTAIHTLTRLLLLYTARLTGSSHLLLGTSLTSLAVSLISSISQGGGFVVREEAEEEWVPDDSADIGQVDGDTRQRVRVIRPLRAVGMKECAMWAWWKRLDIVGREKFSGGKQSIGTLTRDFIFGLEKDYPSTVSTIARTCAKLAPKERTEALCVFCEQPAQHGVQDWKARISIRAHETSSSLSPSDAIHPDEQHNGFDSVPGPESLSTSSLTPHLCYACHTTLTSRSSRGTPVNSWSPAKHLVPFPVWVTSKFLASSRNKAGHPGHEEIAPAGEVWRRTKMKDDQIEAAVSEFLINE